MVGTNLEGLGANFEGAHDRGALPSPLSWGELNKGPNIIYMIYHTAAAPFFSSINAFYK